MSNDESTPVTGTDSTEQWPPYQDQPDEQVADELIDRKNEIREVVNQLDRALKNEEPMLTDGDVEELGRLGNELRGISSTLVHRVPPEGRHGNRSE
jgi:hypothetical protein